MGAERKKTFHPASARSRAAFTRGGYAPGSMGWRKSARRVCPLWVIAEQAPVHYVHFRGYVSHRSRGPHAGPQTSTNGSVRRKDSECLGPVGRTIRLEEKAIDIVLD